MVHRKPPTGKPHQWAVIGLIGLFILASSFGAAATLTEPNGSLLVGVQGPGNQGKIVQYENGSESWRIENAVSYHGVSRLQNGSILAAYAVAGKTECNQFDPPCGRTGVRIIDPTPTPHVVWEWSYAVRSLHNSEVHDVEQLPSGNLLIADMEYESIFVLNPSTGEKVWTWNASSHYEAPNDPTKTDWIHINDVDRIGDERYLVSVRNENQLLIIERGEGVVEVINRNRDPEVINQQHNPQWLGDGRVLVADSENNRVVELARSESGDWKPVWGVSSAAGSQFNWPRDADRLQNGTTIITDSRNNRVVAVNKAGETLWVKKTPALPYEADYEGNERSGSPPFSTSSDIGTRTDTSMETSNQDKSPQNTETSNPDQIPRPKSEEIPVLTPLLHGVQHTFPTPSWVSEIHIGSVLIILLTLIGGGAISARRRWR